MFSTSLRHPDFKVSLPPQIKKMSSVLTVQSSTVVVLGPGFIFSFYFFWLVFTCIMVWIKIHHLKNSQ